MNHLITKLGTLRSLGARNLMRVAKYRLALRIPASPLRRIRTQLPGGPFFRPRAGNRTLPRSSGAWNGEASYFDWFRIPLGSAPPDWKSNPMTGERFADPMTEWWRIPDFDSRIGDIKTVWEASRFDWVLAMAQRACEGNVAELQRLNSWIAHWCESNPAYLGPNWKCGQEASIRVMHLAVAALILDQARDPEPALQMLIHAHLARIAPSLGYALAQDNNHGTSEAAALFVGGSWLAGTSKKGAFTEAHAWAALGRKWLEERVERLVAEDGSFSQHSVVYHRVLLDTLSVAESWRRALGLQPFSAGFARRARAAALWLREFTQPQNGDAPNIGANDGARLIPLSDSDYRDFRPSAQLGCTLFAGMRAFAARGAWDDPLAWLGIPPSELPLPDEAARLFDDGGYALLRNGSATAYLRYPRFRFRPGQADALHLDLWVDGANVLRDAGSYSYNAGKKWTTYFPGTAAHNTVEFDDRDQMPRLGRFLFGAWLETTHAPAITSSPEGSTVSAGYRDHQGAMHLRRITLGSNRIVVEDTLSGFRKAILRWRLQPGHWHGEGPVVSKGGFRLSVSSTSPIRRVEMTEGWESRYYLRRDPLPVFEAEIDASGVMTTEFSWDS